MKKLILSLLLIVAFSSFAKAQNADSLFLAGNYKEALTAYNGILSTNRKDVKALRRTAYIYSLYEGWESKSEYLYREALKIEPENPATNYYLGILLKQIWKHDKTPSTLVEAKKYLNTALKFGSEEAKAELEGL